MASRRAAERLIRSGRVTVGTVAVMDPARDVDVGDEVALDGRPITKPPQRVVYALNKPPGVVSTAHDPQGRTTVVSLLGGELRLYPVGRLDIDTRGLILLTNDGELAHRLTHPRYEVEKTYVAVVSRPPVGEHALRMLRDGVELDDGLTAPASVRRLAPEEIEITIHEGRKRQVKRMCERVGHPVRRLTRTRFGPLELGTLKPGQFRRLTEAEISLLPSAGSEARPYAASSSSGPRRPPLG